MDKAYFAVKLKRKLGILPNVFVLMFIFFTIAFTAFTYFYGVNNSLASSNSSNLEIIKNNNIQLLAVDLELANSDQSDSINIFQERIKEEIKNSSDLIILGGEKYYLSKDCSELKESINCKFFKQDINGELIMIQTKFNDVLSEKYIYYDSIEFKSRQSNYTSHIEFNLMLSGKIQSVFNFDLDNSQVLFVNEPI